MEYFPHLCRPKRSAVSGKTEESIGLGLKKFQKINSKIGLRNKILFRSFAQRNGKEAVLKAGGQNTGDWDGKMSGFTKMEKVPSEKFIEVL
ncbi:hypothetical protein [Echinicola sp. 20G]|uniref:hypothetical protein n=1 Tax=Echinicola sp. 20G TaxID=2781961 RepID=UPI0019104743|nr:hypothetical protein [Echinicola sp. 20G]